MKTRLIRLILASAAALAIAAAIVWWQIDHLGSGTTAAVNTAGVSVGGPFRMVDQTGRTVTDADFHGKYLLIYFGYTFCPDVCPTELQTMAQALERLGPAAERVQPIFVTVDPERDTPRQLADYVAQFDPRLVGLTGTPEQVAAMARAYRVYYAKAKGDSPDNYLMDHSSFVYFMAPDGTLLDLFARGTNADKMADAIGSRMKG
jgi:protein SCO1/2